MIASPLPGAFTRSAMVFNAFIWMQFFNMLCSRRIKDECDYFSGIITSPTFIVVMIIIGGFQAIIMQTPVGIFFKVLPETGPEWGCVHLNVFVLSSLGQRSFRSLVARALGSPELMCPCSFVSSFFPDPFTESLWRLALDAWWYRPFSDSPRVT